MFNTVVPWSRVRRVMRGKLAAKAVKPPVTRGIDSSDLGLGVPDESAENRAVSAHGLLLGRGVPSSASRASRDRRRREQQSGVQAAGTPTASQVSVQGKGAEVSYPGSVRNELPSRQVDHYPDGVTAFQVTPVASTTMVRKATPLPSSVQYTLAVLSENVRRIKEACGMSYASLARKVGSNSKSFGNLAEGRHTPSTDVVISAAFALKQAGAGVEPWQLLLPHAADLTADERANLQRLVESYIEGSPALRRSMLHHLDVMAEAVETAASGKAAPSRNASHRSRP